MVRGCDFLTLY